MKTLGILVALLCSSQAFASTELSVQNRHFEDAQGRTVILRGVNISGNSKIPPFAPLDDMAKLDRLAAWGFNTIRLIFMWEAYEPSPGNFDQQYLNSITNIVDAAWVRGLYVILDMHQDSYSRYWGVGCGDGFPDWAVPKELRRKDLGTPEKCSPMWAIDAALKPAMHKSFRAFYANTDEVRSRFVKLWHDLALHFRLHPAVIGYDLLNEPWGDEKTELLSLYEETARAIAEVDPTAIIFVEPHIDTVTGIFKSALPKPEIKNLVYAPHFYDAVASVTRRWSSWNKTTGVLFSRMYEKAAKLEAPLFVGEFGSYADTGNVGEFVDYQYDLLDKELASSAQWNYTPSWTKDKKDGWNQEDYSIVNEKGELRANFHVRPYAQKTAGKIIRMKFSKGAFEHTWENDPKTGATEIYLPKSLFKTFQTNGIGLECALEAQKLLCASPQTGLMSVHAR